MEQFLSLYLCILNIFQRGNEHPLLWQLLCFMTSCSLCYPLLLTSPCTSSPLHGMSSFKSCCTAAVTSSCCLPMQSQPRTQTCLPLLRRPTVGLLQISRKLDDLWHKLPIFLFPYTLFPSPLDFSLNFCGLKKKASACFFSFTLFNVTGIISPPFYLRFSFFGTIQYSFLLSNKLLLRDARHICPGDSWLSLT